MILHVDMDAFYASVEVRDRPDLKGKPVIVGGTPEGRGVVAAASYAARKFGVHSAMPAAQAKRLCPHAIFLPARMEHYAEESRKIRDIFHRFTPLVEPLSLDEAFLDVTGSRLLFGHSVEIGRQIKREISEQLQLVASVGVAPNKFLAKIASDLEKPDGFVIVPSDRVQEFLDPLPIRRLWGVGRVTAGVLEKLNVHTIRDIRRLPPGILQQHFGEHGRHLWELSQGIDERPVVPDRQAKSISHETTFADDIADIEVLRAWSVELTEQVARRLRRHHLRGRTIERMETNDAAGVKVMSMGFMVPAEQAVIWRGPMLHKALTQMMAQTNWGELDYLIIDMPPGTGDVALSLSQSVGLSGAVVVCTPQQVALLDAVKAIAMFRQVKIPVLGMVENMSGDIFGRGGTKAKAAEMNVPFLGEVPAIATIREMGDAGQISELFAGDNPAKAPLMHVCQRTAIEVAKQLLEQPSMPQLEIL